MSRQIDGSRKRKIDNSLNAEITADDVCKLWEETKKLGSHPDSETNELLAEFMNAWRCGGAGSSPNASTLNAIRTLLKDDQDYICSLGGSAGVFKRLLLDLERQVASHHEASKRSFQPAIVIVVWSVIGGILETDLGGHAGKTRQSVAVKLTAAALKRMGWNGIDAPGIEALLKKLPVNTDRSLNDTN